MIKSENNASREKINAFGLKKKTFNRYQEYLHEYSINIYILFLRKINSYKCPTRPSEILKRNQNAQCVSVPKVTYRFQKNTLKQTY